VEYALEALRQIGRNVRDWQRDYLYNRHRNEYYIEAITDKSGQLRRSGLHFD
jgi:hypothetical protein